MSAEKTPEQMTAYERWELPNLEDPKAASKQAQGRAVQKSVKPLTAEDIESIRAQAYQDGLQQGIDEGRLKGLELGKAEGVELGRRQGLDQGRKESERLLLETKQQLESVMKELLQPIQSQQQQYEQVMLNISLAISRAVIHQELQINPSVIETALHRVVEGLPSSVSQVAIRLNPEDFAHVNSIVKNLGVDARILADGAIMRGGCIVESSEHIIDHTIEKRFQKVVQAMLVTAAQASSEELPMESPSSLQNHAEFPRELLDEPIAQSASSEPDGSSLEPGMKAEKQPEQPLSDGIGLNDASVETDDSSKYPESKDD
jgi:flagellar assembly protein FliH